MSDKDRVHSVIDCTLNYSLERITPFGSEHSKQRPIPTLVESPPPRPSSPV
jgi:hypothetical protein